jgi:RNA polymerase sigma-70 factor, ECF subfamily
MVASLSAEQIVGDTHSLVSLAQSGNSHAFGELYRKHAPLVRSVLLAHAPPDEVPDLAHDTFLLALERIADVREPSAFPGWLAAIARNVARAHRRSAKDSLQLTDDIPAPSAATDTSIECARVLTALQTLPKNLREPLLLRLVEQMSGEEIAANLGITHASVRVSLHRGLKLLRKKLETA